MRLYIRHIYIIYHHYDTTPARPTAPHATQRTASRRRHRGKSSPFLRGSRVLNYYLAGHPHRHARRRAQLSSKAVAATARNGTVPLPEHELPARSPGGRRWPDVSGLRLYRHARGMYLIKKKLDNREHPGHVSKEQRVSHSQLNGHPKQSALIICSTNTPYIARAV